MAPHDRFWLLLQSDDASNQHKGLDGLFQHRHDVRKVALSQARSLYSVLQNHTTTLVEQQSSQAWTAAVLLLSNWIVQPGTYKLSGEARLAQQLFMKAVNLVLKTVSSTHMTTAAKSAAARFLAGAASGVDLPTRSSILEQVVQLVSGDSQLATPAFVGDTVAAMTWLIGTVKDDPDQTLWAVAGAIFMWASYVWALWHGDSQGEQGMGPNARAQVAPSGPSTCTLVLLDTAIQSLLHARHLMHRVSTSLLPFNPPITNTKHLYSTKPGNSSPAARTEPTNTVETVVGALQSGMLQHSEPAVRAVCCMLAAGLLEGLAAALGQMGSSQGAAASQLHLACRQLLDGLMQAASDVHDPLLPRASFSLPPRAPPSLVSSTHALSINSSPPSPAPILYSSSSSNAPHSSSLLFSLPHLLHTVSAGLALTFVAPHLDLLGTPLPPPLPAVISPLEPLFLLCTNLHGLYAAAASAQPPTAAHAWLVAHSSTGTGRLAPQVGRAAIDFLRGLPPDWLVPVVEACAHHTHRASHCYAQYALNTPQAWIDGVDAREVRLQLDRLFATVVVFVDVALQQDRDILPAAGRKNVGHGIASLALGTPATSLACGAPAAAPASFQSAAAATVMDRPELDQPGMNQPGIGQPNVDQLVIVMLDTLSHLQFCKVSLQVYDQLLANLTKRVSRSPATSACLLDYLLPDYSHLCSPCPEPALSQPLHSSHASIPPKCTGSTVSIWANSTHSMPNSHSNHTTDVPALPPASSLFTGRRRGDTFMIDRDTIALARLLFLLHLSPLCVTSTKETEPARGVAQRALPYVFLLINHPEEKVGTAAHSVYAALVQALADKGERGTIEESLPYYVHLSTQGIPKQEHLDSLSQSLRVAIPALPAGCLVPLLGMRRLMEAAALLANITIQYSIPAPSQEHGSGGPQESGTGGPHGGGNVCRRGGLPHGGHPDNGLQQPAHQHVDHPDRHVALPGVPRHQCSNQRLNGHAEHGSHQRSARLTRGRWGDWAARCNADLDIDQNAGLHSRVYLQHLSSGQTQGLHPSAMTDSSRNSAHTASHNTSRSQSLAPVIPCRPDTITREELLKTATALVGVVCEVLMVVDYDLLPAAVQVVAEGFSTVEHELRPPLLDAVYQAVLHCHDHARKPHLLCWCLSLYSH